MRLFKRKTDVKPLILRPGEIVLYPNGYAYLVTEGGFKQIAVLNEKK